MASITAGYSAVLGLLFIGLSIRVIRSRRDTRIPLGSGNYPRLQRAMRVHGNFAEYAPLALVLLLLADWVAPRPGCCTAFASRY